MGNDIGHRGGARGAHTPVFVAPRDSSTDPCAANACMIGHYASVRLTTREPPIRSIGAEASRPELLASSG